jgi:hypothetical protein
MVMVTDYYPKEALGKCAFLVLTGMRGYGHPDKIEDTGDGYRLLEYSHTRDEYRPAFPVDTELFKELSVRRAIKPEDSGADHFIAGPKIIPVWSQACDEMMRGAHAMLEPGVHSKWSSIFNQFDQGWVQCGDKVRYHIDFTTPLGERLRVFPVEKVVESF